MDGVTGKVAEDEFAIVLGERDGNNVVAATVDAYTTPPDVEAGKISDISGPTITLGDEWGGDQRKGDDQNDDRDSGDHGNDRRGNHGQDAAGRANPKRHGGADDPTPSSSASEPGDDPQPGQDAEPGDDPQPSDDPQPGDDSQPGDDTEPGDDQPTTVDLTNVPVVLNGGSTVNVSTLTTGERIVVLGETDATSGTFIPQIAFAFNQDDRHPATRRHHHDD